MLGALPLKTTILFIKNKGEIPSNQKENLSLHSCQITPLFEKKINLLFVIELSCLSVEGTATPKEKDHPKLTLSYPEDRRVNERCSSSHVSIRRTASRCFSPSFSAVRCDLRLPEIAIE